MTILTHERVRAAVERALVLDPAGDFRRACASVAEALHLDVDDVAAIAGGDQLQEAANA